MRLFTPAALIAAAPAAEAAVRDGAISVGDAGNPLTPWLALASVAMVATLLAAHWLVTRRPPR